MCFFGEREFCKKFGLIYVKPISMQTQDVPPCINTCYKVIFFIPAKLWVPKKQVVIIKQVYSTKLDW